MANKEDLRGRRFGRLTVIDASPRKDGHSSWWVCQCDCGNIKEVSRSCLIRGASKSCGCLKHERAVAHGKQMMSKHGWYGTRVYSVWKRIIDRCENPSVPQYKNYGGRGIRMCDEWRNNPKAFCEWAIAHGYAEGLSLDRIDVNGDYEPNNCRWITMGKQQTNKRNNVTITFNGKTQCVAEWARELGLTQHRLYQRVKAGWTNPQEILFGRKKGEIYG